ncbi:MAG: hypothetical protein C4519_18515 [Desulfobacteraceae bacterium]|nr:MAG: hypothetical protein C4519_18515 [Desulfobacteraceae bacterium]
MEIQRIEKKKVVERLDDPQWIIIDVRRHQEEQELKIKESISEDPEKVSAWADAYPLDKQIVLYCA